MSHIQGEQDKRFHDEKGEHVSTPATTNGHALMLYEEGLRKHLELHRIEDSTSTGGES